MYIGLVNIVEAEDVDVVVVVGGGGGAGAGVLGGGSHIAICNVDAPLRASRARVGSVVGQISYFTGWPQSSNKQLTEIRLDEELEVSWSLGLGTQFKSTQSPKTHTNR